MKKTSRVDSDFAAQYKHPLWQKKRLEVMDAAGFTCQRCESDQEQLHVHHRQYIKGRKLWEYSIDELEVVCHCCHEEAHIEKDVLTALLARVPTSAVAAITDLIVGYLETSVCHIDTNDLGQSFGVGRCPVWRLSGAVAASAAACCTTDEIAELSRQLGNAMFGGEISLTISGMGGQDEGSDQP